MCANQKVLKLTEGQVQRIVDVLNETGLDLNVQDVTLGLREKGLTFNDAKELENGELVFTLALRMKKSFDE